MKFYQFLPLAVLIALPNVARANSAEDLNDAGKQLFAEREYDDALVKFQAAAKAKPSGKYYFNVCFTLTQLGRYKEALAACEKVEPSGADDKLKAKVDKEEFDLQAIQTMKTDIKNLKQQGKSAKDKAWDVFKLVLAAVIGSGLTIFL